MEVSIEHPEKQTVGCTALLVDDDESFRKILRFMLEHSFPTTAIQEAGTGKQAREKLDSCPSIIFMDMRLPDVSGIALTKEIKDHCPDTVVVMLTGSDYDDYQEAVLASGASDFVVKDSVLAGVRRWMQTVCSPSFEIHPT